MKTSERMIGVCEKGDADNLSAEDEWTVFFFSVYFSLVCKKNSDTHAQSKDFPLYLKGFVPPPTVCVLGVSLRNPGQLQICDSSASTSQNSITIIWYCVG